MRDVRLSTHNKLGWTRIREFRLLRRPISNEPT